MNKTLAQRFADLLGYCRDIPDNPALLFNGDMLTFAGFGARVQAVYDALQGLCDGPVLIQGHKDLDIVPAMVAATMSGRGFVFAETAYPQSRIDQMILLCDIKVVIKTNPKALALALPTVETWTLADVLLRDLRLSDADENALFYITFTSGSTGVPKGIPTRRACFAALQNWFEPQNTSSKGGAGAHVNHASMAFDMSMSDIWTALFAGRGLYLIDHADTLKPRRIINTLTSRTDVLVGTFTATPAFFALMLGDPKFNATVLPALKTVWIGGDAVQQSILRDLRSRFPDCEIFCGYGPSEAACITHSRLLSDEDIQSTGFLNLGLPQPGGTAMILTSEGLQNSGRGEVVLIGDQVAETYLPLDHPNNKSFFRHKGRRAFSTGDIGEIDKYGQLKVFGRSDGQVKINGYRIELAEIERTAQQVAGIKFAIARLSASDTLRELVLVITPEIAGQDLIDTVRDHIRASLPRYMVPAQIITQDSMPLTVAGKIDRNRVIEKLTFT